MEIKIADEGKGKDEDNGKDEGEEKILIQRDKGNANFKGKDRGRACQR